MDIIQILQKTITGTPEEIDQISYFLKQQQGNPEYISCLLQIISNAELEEILRLAAAIQLKLQVQNNFELPLDFTAICTLIVNSPIRVQLQLQVILYDFVQKRVDLGQIEQVISACAEFIQTDSNHALVSVLILRYLIKNYHFEPEHITFIEQFFQPISTLILSDLESEDISQFSLFIHTSLLTASKYLNIKKSSPLPAIEKSSPLPEIVKSSPLPAIENWVEIITRIINQPAYQCRPLLDKDAIKLACELFKYLHPQVNASLLLSIATHSINGASFETTAMSFKYLNPALRSNEIWPMIEQHQFDLVGGLYFRTFTLSQEDLNDINDNLLSFITTTQVSAFDERTPRNGAAKSFSDAVYNHPTLAECAVRIVLCELESFRESGDIGRAYGALQFAGFALQKAPEQFAQKTAHIIYDTALSMLQINNFIYTAGFFQFIGLKPGAFNDVSVLFKCFEAILNYPSSAENQNTNLAQQLPNQQNVLDGYIEDPTSDLVQYFASHAAANLFANFEKDTDLCIQIRSEVNNNGSIKPLLSNVLRICKLYPTDQSAVIIRHFTKFFVENIAPVATEYVNELFLIFLQYASEPSHYAPISITSCQCQISDVCRVIREQRTDVPSSYFSEALYRIEEVALQCNPRILEDVLELMACFTECITEISEPFVNVPRVLLSIIQRGDNDCINQSDVDINDNNPNPRNYTNQVIPDKPFIKVIKALIKIDPVEVTSSPQMFLPIIEIAKHFLIQFNNKSNDCVSSIPLFQLIFIKLKPYPAVGQFVQMFLEMIDQISPTFIADVVAALVYFNPVLTLQNGRNFERWMSAQYAAFLLSALSVLQCWESLPTEITQMKDQIVKKISENLAILNDNLQKNKYNEDPDIFNVSEILQAFSEINLQ
ncbi:hypothetical protein M9Y10_001607 [Tritrichomonas musculus]|uniref:Importin N-terminal domain-containing protein n=1 Tax=Tritrichomonas musculus TaxID=1915356 RepID=A0ABR2L7G2_9EUKA